MCWLNDFGLLTWGRRRMFAQCTPRLAPNVVGTVVCRGGFCLPSMLFLPMHTTYTCIHLLCRASRCQNLSHEPAALCQCVDFSFIVCIFRDRLHGIEKCFSIFQVLPPFVIINTTAIITCPRFTTVCVCVDRRGVKNCTHFPHSICPMLLKADFLGFFLDNDE